MRRLRIVRPDVAMEVLACQAAELDIRLSTRREDSASPWHATPADAHGFSGPHSGVRPGESGPPIEQDTSTELNGPSSRLGAKAFATRRCVSRFL